MAGPQAYTDKPYCATMVRCGDLVTGYRAIAVCPLLRQAKLDGTTVDIQLCPFGLLIRHEDRASFELPKISTMLSTLLDNLIERYPKLAEFRVPLDRVFTILSASIKNTSSPSARYGQSSVHRIRMTLPFIDIIYMHQIELLGTTPMVYGIKIFDGGFPYIEFFLGNQSSKTAEKRLYNWP